MIRTRGLCLLLICSAFLWGALCIWCSSSRQTQLFFAYGAEIFSDFNKATERRDEVLMLAVGALVLPCTAQSYTLICLLPALALIDKSRLTLTEVVRWLAVYGCSYMVIERPYRIAAKIRRTIFA